MTFTGSWLLWQLCGKLNFGASLTQAWPGSETISKSDWSHTRKQKNKEQKDFQIPFAFFVLPHM
jgi:hypothetical protein